MDTHHKIAAVNFILMGMFMLLPSFVPAAGEYVIIPNKPVSWMVLPNSFITISGSSNINTFGCGASGSFKSETLHGSTARDGKTVDMKGAISIAINEFDCKSRMLNKDLRKTLKAKEFPEMVIRFVSLEHMPSAEAGEDVVNGRVIIELAGQRKLFNLSYTFTKTPSGFKLQGGRSFSFADFNLSPPKKIAGLVKVKDDFDVAFTLLLHNVN